MHGGGRKLSASEERGGVDGIHDLGGMHGFGPVLREENEPVFHADWEAVVYAMSTSMRPRFWNGDEGRHGIERMDPAEYLATSYYEHWLSRAETLLIEKGVLSAEEHAVRLAAVREQGLATRFPVRDAPDPAALPATAPQREPLPAPPPRFAVGNAVRARNIHPGGHTRLPRYVRGRPGMVTRVHAPEVFPDLHADGQGRHLQTVYTVRFSGQELWGESAEPGSSNYIDLWEQYLEPA